MDKQLFDRFAERLREQRRNVISWLNSAPKGEKSVRLASQPDVAAQTHLGVLEDAIRKADAEELGRCTVCHDFIETHWLETNYTNCVCLEHLSGEERSRLEAELELSQKVQKALLPQSLPPIAGWELGAFSQPASIVGGDYFDFLRFKGGAHAIVIADVMGKGMPASMLMASLQASLRIVVPESDSPAVALDRINLLFHHNINLTKFVTMVIAQLDPRSETIRYVNAGHNPPILIRKGGRELEPLLPTGAAIGLVENAKFTVGSLRIGPGESLVLYTDGVVEAGNGESEFYGDDRLNQFLHRHSASSPAELIRELRVDLKKFVGDRPSSDDTTIVVLRRVSA